ncbi:MAG TPA: AI-2E family transporter [Bryobacteraceae bacterium]|nr:AI-2E family transporter [Bryobacteraceae bacterium]
MKSPSTRAARITLIVLLTIAAGLCVLMVWPFAATIIAAAVLAVVCYPLHVRLQSRVSRPGLAALLSTLLVLIAFLVPLTLLATTVTQELRAAYQALAPGATEQGAGRIWAALDRPLAAVGMWLGMQPSELRSMLETRLQEAGSALLGKTIAVLGAAGGGVVKIVIGIGTLYCTFLYGSRLRQDVVTMSPLGPRRTTTLLIAVHDIVMASFYGVIAVAAAQGLLCGLGAWIAGLPSPTLWGVAAAVVSVLPLFGSALVWLPAAAVLFVQGSIGRGVFMLIWGAGLVGTIDNFIRPMVVMTKLPVHPLVVFVAMLGGVEAFGLMGILFGPVILAVTMALFQMLREEMGSGEPG